MTIDSQALLNSIAELRNNPSAIQRTILQKLEDATNGDIGLVDPTNPFVFLLEASTLNATAAIGQTEALTRKLYPSMAQTEEDLYLHMSDVDYSSRFATPSRTNFIVFIGKEELYDKAVRTDQGQIRKLTIPRNTEFTVAGHTFTMQYPIDLRILAHGGLQIVYDVSRQSPLETLETNIVDWTTVELNGTEFIRLNIPVSQFQISSSTEAINKASAFNTEIDYSDKFHYCRVFMSDAQGEWQEIKTTHTDQVYDPTQPTAALTVFSDRVRVYVPEIYITTNQLGRSIRIDVYTTKGPLDLLLENYEASAFGAQWIDLEGDDDGVFSAPLATYSALAVFSDSVVTGGTNGMSFEKLRERVIHNSLGKQNLPITNNQIATALEDLGYGLVKNIDNVTNRTFLATRRLPVPSNGQTVTSIGASINLFQSSLEFLQNLSTVRDNGARVTILPDTLYRNDNGVIEAVTESERAQLLSMSNEALVSEVNSQRFLYSPFHYVLDTNDNIFTARAYRLDDPKVDARTFVAENDTAVLEISTGSYLIEKKTGGDGYILTVVTRSGPTIKELTDSQVQVQLSFTPTLESNRAYLSGEFVGMTEDGEERIYQFDIGTRYDVTENDELVLTTFKLFDDTDRELTADMLTEFDLIYTVTDYTVPGLRSSDIDNRVADFLLPEGTSSFVGVTNERLRIRLGHTLDNLWSKSRSVVSSIAYQRYEADVPWIYEQTVYERNPETGNIVMDYDSETGEITYNILHEAGDPLLDENDEPVYRHRAGDVKVNGSGEPIPESPRKMLRQAEMFFLDGRYYFANEDTTVEYRDSIPTIIVGWLNDDIEPISKRLLERTELYYYPQSTLGRVEVSAEGGDTLRMDAEQGFTVRFYISPTTYQNTELRVSLSETATEVISQALLSSTVTVSDIIATLEERVGGDVIGVDVTGLGGETPIRALTISDDSVRTTIRKRLTARADGSLTVEDDINIEFIRHGN